VDERTHRSTTRFIKSLIIDQLLIAGWSRQRGTFGTLHCFFQVKEAPATDDLLQVRICVSEK
jgi:hypothetical protein